MPVHPEPAATTPATTSLRDFHTFGQYSQFLRAAVADEESLQLGEGLQGMATHVETLVGLLRAPGGEAGLVAQHLRALLEVMRAHGQLLQELGPDWQVFYEFKAHAETLAHFRLLAESWAHDLEPPTQRLPAEADFELAAWRVLGAGAMLLDVYEASALRMQEEGAVQLPWALRLRRLWRRFLTVLHLAP